MTPKFSIIIPVYNVAPYLRECLNSVLAQTFTDWEAICVDDGSTDGSGTILEEYANRDKRFRVLCQANSGVSVARNSALDVVQGEYICFLDSDDVIDRRWLSSAWRISEQTHADWIRMRFTKWRNGCPIPSIADGNEFRIYDTAEQTACYGWSELPANGWICLNFFRRLKVGGIRFPVEVTNCEDVVFNLRVLPSLQLLCQGEFAGYLYRIRKGSSCRNRRTYSEVSSFIKAMSRILPERLQPSWLRNIALRNTSWAVWKLIMGWSGFNDSEDVNSDFKKLMDSLRESRRLGGFTCSLGNRWSIVAYFSLLFRTRIFLVVADRLFKALSSVKHLIFRSGGAR